MRRDVVVNLIEEMQRRGHSAYEHLDMNSVRERAVALPDDDVPPEIIRTLPFDKAHEKLQPQKNGDANFEREANGRHGGGFGETSYECSSV